METILLESYEHRSTRFSPGPQRVKVAEADITNMTIDQREKLFEIQEMLGRTYKISRRQTISRRDEAFHGYASFRGWGG